MSSKTAINAAKKILQKEQSGLTEDCGDEAIDGTQSHDTSGKKAKTIEPDGNNSAKNQSGLDSKASDADVELVDDPDDLPGSSADEISEQIEELFQNGEFSDEFRNKASTLFKAAVNEKVREKYELLLRENETIIEEKISGVVEDLSEKLDTYLKYVVEEWVTDNKVALEHGIKNEITESFILGLRNLFVEHNINIPDDDIDALVEAKAQITDTEERLNDTMGSLIAVLKENTELQRKSILLENTRDLSDHQIDTLNSLLEDIDFSDTDDYKEKLETIKESFINRNSTANLLTEEGEYNNEETNVNVRAVSSQIEQYAKALSRQTRLPHQKA